VIHAREDAAGNVLRAVDVRCTYTNLAGVDRAQKSKAIVIQIPKVLSVNLRVVKTTGCELTFFTTTRPNLLRKRMVRRRNHLV
jgi:hypothetical protein